MQRNVLETIMGGVVLLIAALFLFTISTKTGLTQDEDGYTLTIRFDRGGSATPGKDVRMSGVKVGTVLKQEFDPQAYQAVVTIGLRSDVKLPKDTSAIITSDGLLGDTYILLEPGADEETLAPGDRITHSQGALNLVDLIALVMGGKQKDHSDAPAQ